MENLAAATGRSTRILSYALPELRPDNAPDADPPMPVHVLRTICWRCAVRRDAFVFAVTWTPAEVTICPNHRIWLGLPGRSHRGRQYDVRDLPDILHAQRRHHRLVRHHGRQTTADAFADAAHITAFWARHGLHDDRRKPLIRAILGHNPLTGRLASGDPITPVVTYPETVDLAYVLAMPGWRHPTGRATKHDLRQFRRDINDHLEIRYRPQDNTRDPLLRWLQKRSGPADDPAARPPTE